jgi:hypothetical protein
MLGGPWPEEPPDPYQEYTTPFPEYAEPSPPSHAVHIMAQRSGDGTATPREAAVQTAFVGLLPVFRIGVFALGLGLLLLAFRGPGPFARLITIIGMLATFYGWYRYLVYRTALAGAARDDADD